MGSEVVIMDDKVPYVPKEVIVYLEETFSIDFIINKRSENGSELVGYIKGTRDVINHLKSIHEASLE